MYACNCDLCRKYREPQTSVNSGKEVATKKLKKIVEEVVKLTRLNIFFASLARLPSLV